MNTINSSEEQKTIPVINIVWEKFEYNKQEISKLSSDFDYGIYQVYGKHNAYGKDALLYIGQANDRVFSKRLSERSEFIESSAIPQILRIGRIVRSNDPNVQLEWEVEMWSEMIRLSEKLLIISHPPAFNKQDNSGLWDKKDKNIHIFNWGDFGDLLPEVSSMRYSFKYWSYETELSNKSIS